MPKVYIMCGKIGSGKSTLAAALRIKYNAVILSVDEIMLALFGQDAGDKHDFYVGKAEEYLYQKSLEIIETGTNVVLDWGFWTKREREAARGFYSPRNIDCVFYYIDIDYDQWQSRLEQRNKAVLAGKSSSYYVDEGLARKFEAAFEAPDKNEIDVWVKG